MNEILEKYNRNRENGDEISQSLLLNVIDELLTETKDLRRMSHNDFIRLQDLEKEVTALRQEHELVKAGIVRNIKDKLISALPDYQGQPCICHCHNMKAHSDARCRCVKNCIHCHPENFVKPPNDFKRIGESNEEADRRMAVVKYKDELKAKIERMRPRIYIDEDLNRIHQECLDGVLKLIEEEV